MTLKEILSLSEMEVNKMTTKELKKIVSQMSSASNKRLKRIENYEKTHNPKTIIKKNGEVVTKPVKIHPTNSPAYQSAKERKYSTKLGGKFGVKGKNLNQLRNEYMANKQFLTSKTGSIRDMTKVQKVAWERMGIDGFSSKARETSFWKAYRMAISEKGFVLALKGGSKEVQRKLATFYTEGKKARERALLNVNRYNARLNEMWNLTDDEIVEMSRHGVLITSDGRTGTLDFRSSEDNAYLMGEVLEMEYAKFRAESKYEANWNNPFELHF